MHFKSKVWNCLDTKINTRFLIRIDDFPRGDLNFSDFMRFHKIMNDYDCPYLLGVTPFLSKGVSKEELNFLRWHKFHNIDLSLHGFTHEKIGDKKYQGEIDCYSLGELEILIEKAKNFFSENDIEFPDSFIPPFNIIKRDSYEVLSKHFSYMMGGPLSITTLGFYKFLDKINTSFYIPSYFPFYGRVKEIDKGMRHMSMERGIVMVVTIHWAWEINNNFVDLKKFLSQNKDRIVNYSLAKKSWQKMEY